MIEKVIENWLTSTTERTFQEPFAQLLLVEGFDVLQGPVHHPFEHGKDIIALDAEGRLCAFQLKSGNMSLAGIRRIQEQLLTMVSTSVSYPGTYQGKPPERAFLVINGNLTPEARDHLRAFNEANSMRYLARIELVEKENLIGRFTKEQSRFAVLENLKSLLELLTANGRGPFMTLQLSSLHKVAFDSLKEDSPATQRDIASSLLATAFATTCWAQEQNHFAVAQAWVTGALAILRTAEAQSLGAEVWEKSYALALSAARGALNEALFEVSSRDDLVVEDVVEGFVYSTRALDICGWASAFYLSESLLPDEPPGYSVVSELLQREKPYIRVCGEAGVPHLFLIAKVFERMGDPSVATGLIVSWLAALARLNQPAHSGEMPHALPNPYVSLQDAILLPFGFGTSYEWVERFDGRAYTAFQALDWLARRDLREPVEALFPDISRLLLVDVQPTEMLAPEDDQACNSIRALPCPSSWAEIRTSAKDIASGPLPSVLEKHPEIIPYFILTFPHRFNRHLGGVLDSLF